MRLNGHSLLLLALLALFLSFVASSDVGTRNDAEAREMFESWAMKHSKVYGTPAEKENRFRIFKANILYIDEHNAKNGPCRLGLNHFADLTKEEFQTMYVGAHKTKGRKMIENSVSRQLNLKKSVNVSNPPKSVDWRKKGAVTSVKDQGNCAGASWAFGAIATVESLYFMKYSKSKMFSEQQVIDCAFAQYGGAGCGSGSSVNDAFQYMKDSGGISTDADYPYTVIPDTCRQNVLKVFQINGYANVPFGDEIELQKAVAQQPVSAMIYVDLNFQLYHSGIYEGPCLNNVGSQGLAIVGYDTENGVDYWILKNSWGVNWGEAGYIRMRRNIGLCDIAERASYPQ